MINLLKSNFYRIYKNKLTFITLILFCIALPVINFGFSYLQNNLQTLMAEEGTGSVLSNTNVDTLIGDLWTISSDAITFVPLLAGVLIVADVSSGSLRNKVICGFKRSDIYFSHFISTLLYVLIFVSAYVLVNAAFGFLFFQSFDAEITFVQVIYWLVTGLFTCAFMSSFVTMISLGTTKLAPTIVFTILFGALYGVGIVFLPLLAFPAVGDVGRNLLCLLPGVSGVLTFYMTFEEFIIGISSLIIFSGIFITIGLAIFKSKDLK